MIPTFSFIILTGGFLIASYVIWRLFVLEQYEETRIVDVIWVTTMSALVGARSVWVALHWDFFRENLLQMFVLHLDEISIVGALIGSILTLVIYLRIIKWPYLPALDILSLGMMIFGLALLFLQMLRGAVIDYYPILTERIELFSFLQSISAWVLFLMSTGLVIVASIIWKLTPKKGYIFCLLLLLIPREPFLLTAIFCWLMIERKRIWQQIQTLLQKRLKNI